MNMNAQLVVVETILLIAAILSAFAGLFSWNIVGPDPNAPMIYHMLIVGMGMLDMYLVGLFGGFEAK